MSIIYLISPAQTEYAQSCYCFGRGNWILSEKGWSQAELTATYLKKSLLDGERFHIVSSPDRRCLSMAGLLSDLTDSMVKISNEFLGIDLGDWKGKDEAALRAGDGNRFEQWLENADFPSPGGESLGDMSRRSWLELVSVAQLLEAGEHLALFAPPEIIGTVTCSLLDAPQTSIHKMRLSPAGIAILKKEQNDQYQLHAWNLLVCQDDSLKSDPSGAVDLELASVK